MSSIPRYAVVPTHNRPTELLRCLKHLCPQVDWVLVVDNASDPPVTDEMMREFDNVIVDQDDEQPPNLSRLWNIGIDFFREVFDSDVWDVALINDDAILPPGWFESVSSHMRATDSYGGYSTAAPQLIVHGPWATPSVFTRFTGWAFMLRGESSLRADERLRWWCGDDDLSMQARRLGGIVHAPGMHVENTLADTTTTGELAAQAALDMQTFVDKWGVRPW